MRHPWRPRPTPPSRGVRLDPIGLARLGRASRGVVTWALLGAGGPVAVTLAVLPFENLSGDPDRDYLADGLTEETIASLGQVDPERLSVIGRTSVMLARRDGEIPRGDRARARRRLPARELHPGRERPVAHHGQADSCARPGPGVVAALRPRAHQHARVAAGARARRSRSRSGSGFPRSGSKRWRGENHESPRPTTSTFAAAPSRTSARRRRPRQAIEYYERATALDPDYALAWSALADAYAGQPDQRRRRSARGAASRRETPCAGPCAPTPTSPRLSYAVGYLNWMLEWDWPAAEAAFRRAIDLDPRYAWAHTVARPPALAIGAAQRGTGGHAPRARARSAERDGATPCRRRSPFRRATIRRPSSTPARPSRWTRSSGLAT